MISSLKIIDASTVLAGPSVGMFFAELGAQVLKIEHPLHPDVTRSWKLASENPENAVSAYFSSVNYGKTYLQLDLKDPQGREAFLEHIREADILLTNFKKGDAAKFNLGEEILRSVNPKLIHGQISGFGKDSDRVAYDLILQAESGFMSINGTAESGPVKMPVALIDVLAAHQLKEGLLVALLERERSGLGKTVHVSLYDAAVCSLINQASSFLMTGNIPERIGSLHPTIAPYGEIFTTQDGAQITFAIGSDTQFMKTCHFLGLELLPDDPLFHTNQQRVIHRSALFSIFQEQLKQMNSTVILRWMEEHFVPCGKIRHIGEVFEDAQAQAFVRTEMMGNQETKRMSSVAFRSW